jgi:predicted nuclease with RNAse H fold
MRSLGVDVSVVRGLDLVLVDENLGLIERVANVRVAEFAEIVRRQRPNVVAIDSPPTWALAGKSRLAERHLLRLGIGIYSAPTDPGQHRFYDWMRVGFEVFASIFATHPLYREGTNVANTAIEVFPHASAVAIAGSLPPAGSTKVRWRRELLRSIGVDSAQLRSVHQVDAALAAVTGMAALRGEFVAVGDPAEGVIVLPTPVLPSGRYPASLGAATASMPHPVERTCGCGCGAPVKSRFLPGHDAKLRSQLRQSVREGKRAAGRLSELGWS